MSQQPINKSRRDAMRVVASGVSAVLLLQSSQMQAIDKMTQRQAEYQDSPQSIFSCATCTLFVQPNMCKVVEGEVSRDGWCKAFALAD